jgi:uncharacterized SAM-binding protein YcdF (DUF218 family)
MKRFLRIAVCSFIALAAWIPFSYMLARYLAVEKPLQSADAIFVLSGSEDYVERTHEAAKLFKAKVAPKIFLSDDGLQGGWHQKERRTPFFVELTRWELIAMGVPVEAIEIMPTIVAGTNDEANLLVKVCAKRNLRSLLLITSPYHTRRTLWTFERVVSRSNLPLEIGIKFHFNEEEIPYSFKWWLSIKGWKTVGAEYAKTFYYWLFY